MKKLFIAVVLIVVSTAAFCQNGFIDGAGVGPVKEVVGHFLKKGYKIQISEHYPNSPIIFMTGRLKSRNVDVLICMRRMHNDTTEIGYICMYFPQSKNVKNDYLTERRKFINGFGKPNRSDRKKSYWTGLGTDEYDNLKYTIGIENGHVYHSLERTINL